MVIREGLIGGPGIADPALLHDHQEVRELAHPGELVFNQDDSLPPALEVFEYFNDAGSPVLVQFRGRFIEDQDIVSQCKRCREHHALFLPTGEVVRGAIL